MQVPGEQGNPEQHQLDRQLLAIVCLSLSVIGIVFDRVVGVQQFPKKEKNRYGKNKFFSLRVVFCEKGAASLQDKVSERV